MVKCSEDFNLLDLVAFNSSCLLEEVSSLHIILITDELKSAILYHWNWGKRICQNMS